MSSASPTELGGSPGNGPKLPLDNNAAYALIVGVLAILAQQFSPTWYTQFVAVLIALGSVAVLIWRWSVTQAWNKIAKGLLILASIALGAFLLLPKTYANYLAETSPDDFFVSSFDFPNQKQLSEGEIDFSVHFNNRGPRPVTVKDLGAFVAVLPLSTPLGRPCSLARVDPDFINYLYSEATPTTGDQFGKDGRLDYYAQRSTLSESSGVSIDPKSSKTVRAKVAGKARTSRDQTTFVCPIIRYFDFDGAERVAICDGFNLVMSGPFFTVPISTLGQFRLLPQRSSVECKAEKGSVSGYATL